MRRAGVLLLVIAGMCGLLAGEPAGEVGAAELLGNGEFERWSGEGPEGWFVSGGAVAVSGGRSGSGARLTTGSGSVLLGQRAAIAGGGTFAAAAWVQGATEGSAAIRLQFYTADLTLLGSPVAETSVALGGWRAVSVSVTAPSNAAYVQISVVVAGQNGGPVDATVDSATLDGSPPVPTATPSPAATVRPATETSVPATEQAGATPTATATAAGYGGLLLNGNFEQEEDGRPRGWAKYGGTMGLTRTAYEGSRAATLAADSSSTYWIHQVVRVRGGQWYEASGHARMAAGTGEAFVRLSWYAAEDGSGSAISTADSGLAAGGGWTAVTTGPVRAPETARSVRVRLMLRSQGAGTAAFDVMALYRVDEPSEAGPPDETTPEAGGGSSTPMARGTNTPRPGGSAGGATGGTTTAPTFRIESQSDGVLRISEVMSDPPETGADSGYEWVEVVNVGTVPVNLGGWRIGDARGSDVLPALTVEPGEFAVVTGKSAAFGAGVKVVRVSDGTIGNGLNNDGDAVLLLDSAGMVVDAMSYGSDVSVFDPAPEAPKAGQTLGVVVAGGEPEAGNWAVTQRPTPGEANVFSPSAAGAKRTPGANGTASAGASLAGGSGTSSPVPLVVTAVMAGAGATVAGSQLWKRRGAVLDRLRRDEGGN